MPLREVLPTFPIKNSGFLKKLGGPFSRDVSGYTKGFPKEEKRISAVGIGFWG